MMSSSSFRAAGMKEFPSFSGFEAFEHCGERGLRTAHPRLRPCAANRERDDGVRGHEVVQGAGNHAELDALQPHRRHLVGGLHHGGNADGKDTLPGDRP